MQKNENNMKKLTIHMNDPYPIFIMIPFKKKKLKFKYSNVLFKELLNEFHWSSWPKLFMIKLPFNLFFLWAFSILKSLQKRMIVVTYLDRYNEI